MDINYEAAVRTPPRRTSEERGDAPESCDWCGRPVSRETAVRRPGGTEGDAVPLCGECEYGTD